MSTVVPAVAAAAGAVAPPFAGLSLALGPVDVLGYTLGLQRGLALLLFPVLAIAVAVLLARRGDAVGSDRERAALLASRTLVVALLVVAAAGPFTVAIETRAANPSVTLLEDRSASTAVTPSVADELTQAIEAEGVRVDRSVIASGNDSRIGDGILANVRANGSVLVLSDGQVTGGRSLSSIDSVLQDLNATVNSVVLEPEHTELSVSVSGPGTTSVDVPNRFEIDVAGVVAESDAGTVDAELVVTVDGTVVEEIDVENASANATLEYSFAERGEHRLTARLRIDDRYAVNDVYRKTVTVVPKPSVLYVSNGQFRFRSYLAELYNLTMTNAVPSELSQYDAIVAQDRPAAAMGNVTALQNHVLRGKGLVLVGGNNSFDRGGYEGTALERMSPVSIGSGGDRRSRIVILIDVSNSGYRAHQFKKALAADVVDQLGDQNVVGVLAFDDDVYRISPLGPLGEKRARLREKILSIDNGFATDIPAGLRAAGSILNDEPGTIILLSDGIDTNGRESAKDIARTLGNSQASVVSVAVGNETDEGLLQSIAALSGGQYIEPDETEKLRIIFGDSERTVSSAALTILDDQHFITRGLRTEARLEHANAVSAKRGAEYLISTTSGTPALTAWRYGVGRVAAVTVYGSDGGLDGLLSRPDSLAMSRTVNWVIGEPQRDVGSNASVPDTRVGRSTTVTYAGDERPTASALSFVRTASGRYEATLRPRTSGYAELMGADYAVNAPAEYAAFGRSTALRSLVFRTGGQRFSPDEAQAIARAVVEQTSHPRPVRTDWAWALAAAGLALLAIEIAVRRLRRFRGRGSLP